MRKISIPSGKNKLQSLAFLDRLTQFTRFSRVSVPSRSCNWHRRSKHTRDSFSSNSKHRWPRWNASIAFFVSFLAAKKSPRANHPRGNCCLEIRNNGSIQNALDRQGSHEEIVRHRIVDILRIGLRQREKPAVIRLIHLGRFHIARDRFFEHLQGSVFVA